MPNGALQSARIGGIAAPAIVLLGAYGPGQVIPFLLFGFITLAAGLSTCFLPETLGTTVPETVQVCSNNPGALLCVCLLKALYWHLTLLRPVSSVPSLLLVSCRK